MLLKCRVNENTLAAFLILKQLISHTLITKQRRLIKTIQSLRSRVKRNSYRVAISTLNFTVKPLISTQKPSLNVTNTNGVVLLDNIILVMQKAVVFISETVAG